MSAAAISAQSVAPPIPRPSEAPDRRDQQAGDSSFGAMLKALSSRDVGATPADSNDAPPADDQNSRGPSATSSAYDPLGLNAVVPPGATNPTQTAPGAPDAEASGLPAKLAANAPAAPKPGAASANTTATALKGVEAATSAAPAATTPAPAVATPPQHQPPDRQSLPNDAGVKVTGARTYLGLNEIARRSAKAGSEAHAAKHGAEPKSNAEVKAAAVPPAKASAGGGDKPDQRAHREQAGAAKVDAAPVVADAAAATPMAAADVVATPLAAATVAVDRLADVIADQAGALAAEAAPAKDGAEPQSAAPSAVKELDIQLDPQGLGAVSIRMRLTDGKLAVVIEVSKASTLKLIAGEHASIADRLGGDDQSPASIVIRGADANPTLNETSTYGSETTNARSDGRRDASDDQRGESGRRDSAPASVAPAHGESRDGGYNLFV
jgi:hypothetical protein